MDRAKKSALHQTYCQFMETGFKSEGLSALQKIVVKEVAGFGSAKDEKVKGIAGLKALLHNQKKQTKGMTLAWKTKPFSRYITEDENTAVFAEDAYLAIKAGKDLIKMYLRFSVVLNYVNNQWKVIHWHGSKPEQVQSEEDTYGIDSLKKKNAELEKLVEEKTADLTQKNRELEIEASLERVRSRTMAMHKTSELQEVIHVVHKELLHLNLSIDGGSFVVINADVDPELRCWGSGGTADTSEEILVPHFNMPFCTNLIKGIKKAPGFFTEEFSQKEKKEYFIKLFKQKPWSQISNKQKKETLSSPGGYTRSVAVSKHTSIFIINHQGKKFTDAENDILKRFAKVFEQTYTRFLDLQKAEAQARGAQIEAAVERVRAISLAMHLSDEIHEVVRTLRHELFGLKLEGIAGATICLKQPDGRIRFWDITDIETSGRYTWDILFDMDNIDPHLWVKRIWNSRKKIISAEQDSADLKRALKWLGHYNKKMADDISKLLKANKITHGWHRAVKLARGILITDFSNTPPAEIDSILLKISAAFDLAYQRFLDLQKAEAQAREAQIEAALERVRSRAMAMHTSDELKEVAKEMRNQLHLLGQKELETCAIHLWDESSGQFEAWAALRSPDNTGKIIESESKFKIKGIKILEENFQHYRDGKKDYVLINDVAKARQFFEALKPVDPKAYAFLSPTIKNKKPRDISAYWAVADFDGGSLVMVTMNPPEDNSRALLRRFADVFGLAYRRFSDLQKAEAQAREAQIEIGLERVRSRAMAMQSSEELKALIGTLFTELTRLDLALTRCIIWVFDPVTNAARWWMANVEEPFNPMSFFINYHEHPAYRKFVKEWKNQNIRFVYDLKGKDKMEWDDILFNETDLKNLPKAVKNGMRAPERILLSASFNNFGGINVASLEPLSDEHFDILLRFAKVFDLTYTRFLDLQKAESQAREAQIQLALERVRARTMAMQDSKELSDTSFLLANQVRELGINAWGCAFHIYADNEEGDYEWFSNEDGYLPFYKTPRKKYFKQYFENRHCNEGIFIKEFKGNACATHYDFLMQIPVVGDALRGLIKSGIALPSSQIDHIVYFEYGYLLFITYKPVPEAHHIFKRFTKEFEQTYIRFLDLQKSEAQTRESQIQLALERVRARTMAMQKSYELGEAATLLFQQVKSLGIETYSSGFTVWENNDSELISWMCNADGSINPPFRMPAKEIEWHRQQYESWKKKEDFIIHDFTGREMKDHYKYLRSFPLLDEAFKKSEAASVATPDRQVHNAFNFSKGNLLFITLHPVPESHEIFKRFAKVFEQTYTRFLDLQKAEAQAREGQIEVTLEKVRSRTMGMQKSEELKDVINLVYEQLTHLNIHVEHCGFLIDYKTRDDLHIWLADEHLAPSEVIFPWFDCPPNNAIRDAKDKGEDFFFYHLNFEEKNKFYRDLFKLIPGIPQETIAYYLHCPGLAGSGVLLESIGLYIENFSGTVYTEEENAVLMRFGKVFQQTYTRFLDLQKAEAQAREAQIEAALERIRAKVTAMQESSELFDIVVAMRNEFILLGHQADYFWHMRWGPENYELSMTSEDGSRLGMVINVPKFVHQQIPRLHEWEKSDSPIFVLALNADEAWDYVDKMNTYGSFELIDPHAPTEEDIRNIGGLTFIIARTTHGEIGFSLAGEVHQPPKESQETLIRFAAVFDLAYRRFEDLKTAEKQNRETQIELALERVRARTMAMQKSAELNPTADLLFEQLRLLGAELQGVAFAICDKDNDIVQKWTSIGVFSFSSSIEPAEQNMYEAWKNKVPLFEEVFEGERIRKYYETLMEVPAFKQGLQQLLDAGIPMPTWQKNHAVSFLQGYLLIITTKPFAETQIFIRFGKVFEQTYTRFLDLQKAEAQAREAQIEAALERVRSRSMAMHKSEELLEVINVVSNQLQQLDIRFGFVCFGVIHPQGNLDFWMAVPGFDQPEKIHMPFVNNPITNSLIEAHKKGTRVLKDIFPKEVMLDWSKTLFENNPDSQIMAQSKEYIQESPGLVRTTVILKEIDVFAGKFAGKPFTDEQNEIIVRFANVFEQSYIRFLDLQKAEMQAREAKIEVSLEKVRTVALILKKSDEMLDVVQALYEALYDLGFTNIRNSIIDVHNPQKETFLDYDYSPQLGRSITEMSYYDSPFIENQVRKTEADNDAFFELILEGKELQELIDMRLKNGEAEDPGLRQTKQLTYNLYSFGNGAIGISNFGLLSNEQKEILKRFRNVFAFAYKRYSDMVQAEALAREAQIEAALEKVRSRTLAMQKSDELADTAAVLFQQLITLGIAPNRLFIIIMKAGSSDLEAWVTDEDGSKISLGFTANYQNNPSIQKMYEGWQQQKKSLVIDMQGEELQQYFHYLHDELEVPFKGGLEQKRRIQHLAYFSHGLIGMASPEEQPAETIQLLERFAAVFNLTFTRFNDLKIAEAHAIQAEQDLIAIKEAKQKAEEALTELQSTQKQLIQSEKMASLGELTAGIAHEIQNPLNFVNNFSEVSKELLDEMKEAIEKGDTEDAKQIMNDVIQNLEKINHHGKRADGIVKGMLQHSRSSTGQKEPTDINALCDEYLRLSYHGLRAKDKTFNAKFETSFDESIGKVNIVPQEIGRVILNLINNAFYAVGERSKAEGPDQRIGAVSEKTKQGMADYEPTVSVATIKENGNVLISVKDNGNGIPAAIKEKIFQPFFTTKPTGQGTGLGLSLSYDIVKGHGGEIKVESNEDDGTDFIVVLPVNN